MLSFVVSISGFAEEVTPQRINPVTHYVNADNVNLRFDPGLTSEIRCVLQSGDGCHIAPEGLDDYRVTIGGIVWVHIYVDTGTNAGEHGWVAEEYLTRNEFVFS